MKSMLKWLGTGVIFLLMPVCHAQETTPAPPDPVIACNIEKVHYPQFETFQAICKQDGVTTVLPGRLPQTNEEALKIAYEWLREHVAVKKKKGKKK